MAGGGCLRSQKSQFISLYHGQKTEDFRNAKLNHKIPTPERSHVYYWKQGNFYVAVHTMGQQLE